MTFNTANISGTGPLWNADKKLKIEKKFSSLILNLHIFASLEFQNESLI